jgi:hypothetical protein
MKDEVKIYENILKLDRQIAKSDIQDNKKSLENHFVFSQFNDSEK